ncbi:MAG: LpqB family beta-propeller domain-containing protein, partial [Dehalococcoidia bacterium]|nr:LpqB family beta-propeller domain-containing protein [Dehalococcoidia bacterium]
YGTAYGEDFVLTTLGPEPIVSTGPATEIKTDSAVIRGTLTSLGVSVTVAVSFEYGETDKYGQATKAEERKETGTFTATLTGLKANTTYHFRARAEGADKLVAYGADVTFTTTSVAPVVRTEAAGNIAGDRAVLNGTLVSMGQATTVTVSFEYGETDKYGQTTRPEEVKSAGAFKAEVSGLKTGITYHYRAKADGGDKGIAYGANVTFTPSPPDRPGRRIAYVVEKDGVSRIYTADEDGANARALETGTSPAWSPDGSKIAFVSDKHPNGQIYVMNADGSGLKRLSTNDAWDETSPAWSPDGSKIAFVSDRDGVGYRIYVMNADGSGVRRLTRGTGSESDPAWSPDGTRIAFVSDMEGPLQVYIITPDASGLRRLTTLPAPAVSPAWSPDGKRLVFAAKQQDRNWAIFIVNADGTDMRRLAAGLDPVWSADGSRVIFRARTDGTDAIYAITVTGGGLPVRLGKDTAAHSPKTGGR